jgi:dienelactone hydrolase
VPDYFRRTKTPPSSIDYQRDGLQVVLTNKDAWQSTLADGVRYAKTLPGIDGSRIGLLGYSLGGYLSLRLRTHAKVIVAFFPPYLDGIGRSSGSRRRSAADRPRAVIGVPPSRTGRTACSGSLVGRLGRIADGLGSVDLPP